MARKRNPENDLVVTSGAAATPARRKTAAARPKHSPTTAETPVSPDRESQPEAPPSSSAAAYAPSHEEIARLAYTYWLDRGCQGGCPEEDWRRAEEALRTQAFTAVV